MFYVGDRSYPGAIMVNGAGRRFTNEAASYVEVVHAMYRQHRTGVSHIPATFIMDQRFRNKYIFGTLFPRQPLPEGYLASGYIKRGGALAGLAEMCGLEARNLEETLARFNRFARVYG